LAKTLSSRSSLSQGIKTHEYLEAPMVLKLITQISGKVYQKIYHVKPTPEVERFLQNLVWSSLSLFFYSLFLTVVHVVAGRYLGPEKYGEFSLLLAAANIVAVPMLFGFNSAITTYIARKDDRTPKGVVLGTGVYLLFLSIFLSCIVYWVLSPFIGIVHLTIGIYFLAIVVAVTFSLRLFFRGVLQGYHDISRIALVEGIAVLLSSIILIVLFVKIGGLFTFVFIYALLHLLIALFIFYAKFDAIEWNPITLLKHSPFVWMYLGYGFFGTFVSLSATIMKNVDRLMINYYLGETGPVGIYQAYIYSSLTFILIVAGVFNTVFLATAAKYEHKGKLLKSLNRLTLALIIPAFVVIIAVEFVFLKLYGSQYPINALWLVLFCINAILAILVSVYGALYSSMGNLGIRWFSISLVAGLIVNVVLNMMLIPKYALTGAITSMIVAYATTLIMLLINRGLLARTRATPTLKTQDSLQA
jgi:O-antigen/teichoic acid export membrane protein